jgi:hypothetical protein
MAMKGPFRDFFAVGPQTVRLRLPELARAKEAKLLVAKKAAPIVRDGDCIRIEVPTVLDHEVIAIDL